jgi:hypothetical protein
MKEWPLVGRRKRRPHAKAAKAAKQIETTAANFPHLIVNEILSSKHLFVPFFATFALFA